MKHSNNSSNKNLYFLDELSDYKVSNSDKDVRKWPVKDKDGEYIGTVENLIISKNDERVVYLDVEMDEDIIKAGHQPYSRTAENSAHSFLNEDGENHIIIPIGMAQLDLEEEIVNTPEISRQYFSETKRRRKNASIDRDYEINVLESYNRDKNMDITSTEREHSNTDLYQRSEYNSMHSNTH